MKGVLWVMIQGCSMEPVLHDRQETLAVPFKKLIPGKCYVFEQYGRVLLHRLVSAKKGWCVFLGDNSGAYEVVSIDCVKGYVDDCQSVAFHLCVNVLNRLIRLLFGRRNEMPYKVYRLRYRCICALQKKLCKRDVVSGDFKNGRADEKKV